MTTVREKRNKVPVFIEDIVMDPSIKRRDVLQIAPKPKPAKPEDEKPLETSSGELFPAGNAPPKIFSRLAKWAEEFHPASPEPLKLNSSPVENYRNGPHRYT